MDYAIGIDIGSKAEIYEQIHSFANSGMSIIFISDEIQEILANCNRVVILSEGRCAEILEEADLDRPDADQRIAALVSQHPASHGKEQGYEAQKD